jgi:hypothetical protein
MSKLPAVFADSAVAALDRWWGLAGELTTSEGARAQMQADLSRRLHAGEVSTGDIQGPGYWANINKPGWPPKNRPPLAVFTNSEDEAAAYVAARRPIDAPPQYSKRMLLRSRS